QPPRSSPPPSPSALAAVGAQLVAYLHELVGRFLPAADSHGTMDPNGAHAQDDSRGTMDPNGHS
ncbi:MAG TPA: hypothetical protein VHR45_09675, partial [Thermoanaerobaculia bacterium]|nr:hypothetical protein [Thermoanaerobaculia bacterium]